jgi:hypothetical protein
MVLKVASYFGKVVATDRYRLGAFMKDEVYPARNGLHRWMGPTDSCDKCYGGGYYITEKGEKYCACPCGKERKRIEDDRQI